MTTSGGGDNGRFRAMAAVQAIFERYRILESMRPDGHVDYDAHVMQNVRLLDAGPEGRVLYEFEIGPRYSNLNGAWHKDKNPFLGGVTRHLSISYLRAVPIPSTVRISAHVVQHGRTMALIRGEMTSVDGRVAYAACEHHKVNVPTRPEHLAAMAEGVEGHDGGEKGEGLEKVEDVARGKAEEKVRGKL
ncbi:hypothetical protein LTR04_000876 [Oleoguttula sp. CCFEE 6159]|nr:hypothetical protein LTR04_000876 [Oleoguttula sp. CCFEE 6159]